MSDVPDLNSEVDDRDTVLDSLALIEAAYRGDADGAQVILHHGRPWAIAGFLACVCRSLVKDLALVVDEPADDLLAEVRRRQKAHFGIES